MKAGWTSLGHDTSPDERTGADPWAGGSWQYTEGTSRPAPELADPRAVTRQLAAGATGAGAAGAAGAGAGNGAASVAAPHTVEAPTRFIETAPHGNGVPAGAPGGPAHGRPPKKRRGLATFGILLLALGAGAAGGLVTEALDDDSAGGSDTVTVIGADPAGLVERPPESIAGVAASVLPSVVSVSVADAGGSGFIISEDGYVITNNHVIASAGDDGIELAFFDGRRLAAELVGTSPSYDIAVLRVDAADLQPVVFGDSDSVAVGDPVVAIGSPLGLDATVTSGIVSALERPVTAGGEDDQSYINALQTDAAINPGNSGGPLVDSAGRVIGVNSAIASLGLGDQTGSIGLGFAIPIEQVQRTAQQLIADGEAVYPVMGVLLDNGFVGEGARVAEDTDNGPGVTPGGPAAEVGIESGDVVVEIDGQEIRTPAELIVRLRAHEPGDEIEVVVDREGEELTFTLTLGSAVG
ncbi:S1C family serine protease [Jiangella mangrovi]|uniref:Putative serine protease PepD n=1 Tax=Jiangella mangrovi TaxID=1524084 RepID=A0A7W9GLH2_9ACTN|nr:trypsin-like peptidase domain-containing protein [Jiangella mangrovi]MBB5785881.1 putative serine protease PepD [Jiangella mangrovi]